MTRTDQVLEVVLIRSWGTNRPNRQHLEPEEEEEESKEKAKEEESNKEEAKEETEKEELQEENSEKEFKLLSPRFLRAIFNSALPHASWEPFFNTARLHASWELFFNTALLQLFLILPYCILLESYFWLCPTASTSCDYNIIIGSVCLLRLRGGWTTTVLCTAFPGPYVIHAPLCLID